MPCSCPRQARTANEWQVASCCAMSRSTACHMHISWSLSPWHLRQSSEYRPLQRDIRYNCRLPRVAVLILGHQPRHGSSSQCILPTHGKYPISVLAILGMLLCSSDLLDPDDFRATNISSVHVASQITEANNMSSPRQIPNSIVAYTFTMTVADTMQGSSGSRS